jgi:tRNA threonylcarbamoyladenosine biosynthesis protein TsaE
MPDARTAVVLVDAPSTLRLGIALGAVLKNAPGTVVLLLRGDLGSGKTTFVRGLAESLPGGDEAEVASPSFNLVNIYPTRPEVVHMDLYRLHGEEARELFEESADPPDEQAPGLCSNTPVADTGRDRPGRILAVEWAEHLPADCLERDHLAVSFRPARAGREVEIRAHGPAAEALLTALTPHLETCAGTSSGDGGTSPPPGDTDSRDRA